MPSGATPRSPSRRRSARRLRRPLPQRTPTARFTCAWSTMIRKCSRARSPVALASRTPTTTWSWLVTRATTLICAQGTLPRGSCLRLSGWASTAAGLPVPPSAGPFARRLLRRTSSWPLWLWATAPRRESRTARARSRRYRARSTTFPSGLRAAFAMHCSLRRP